MWGHEKWSLYLTKIELRNYERAETFISSDFGGLLFLYSSWRALISIMATSSASMELNEKRVDNLIECKVGSCTKRL